MSQLHKYLPLTYSQLQKIVDDMEFVKYDSGIETDIGNTLIFQLKQTLNTFYDEDLEHIPHSIKSTLPQTNDKSL